MRFGLLFNGIELESWHLRCLDHLKEFAALDCVILTTDEPSSPARTTGTALMRLYGRVVHRKEMVHVAKRFENLRRFYADDQQAIEAANLDFVLKLGHGSIPIDMGLVTGHGVWSFQHESERDLLPFFRQFYEAEDLTQAALLALGGSGGEVAILEHGCFRTEKRSYIESRNRILASIAEWPARVCRRLFARKKECSLRADARSMPARSRPEHRPQLFRFCARIIRRRLDLAFERLFRHKQWNIGILPVPVETLLHPGTYEDSSIEWFPIEDRKGFLADPFGIRLGATLHVLCEYFGYSDGKGHICTLAYSNQGFTRRLEPAITLPVHMSYPFLIEDSGQIYCVPETCHANEVALFKAVEFPRRWSKVAVLVERFAGLDPTVFHHGGRWWLMCTKKGREQDAALWVWHAPNLLGPWTPHAQNPVKTDVRGARPGGAPFVHDGELYRPTQDCSKVYGWRIAVQLVTTLTPTDFVEEVAAVLEASADSPFPLGRHTLTPVGDVVLIDGHRAVFAWSAFRSFLGIWMSDLSRKVRRLALPF